MTGIGAVGAFAGLVIAGTLLRWRAVVHWGAIGVVAVNLAGTFAAGWLSASSGPFVTALVVGGLGALTTVSGMATQVVQMAADWGVGGASGGRTTGPGHASRVGYWIVGGYFIGLVGGGVSAALAGIALAG